MSRAAPQPGRVAAEVRAELPGLGLLTLDVALDGRLGRSPRGVRERLDLLADRMRGAEALVIRQRPVPHAYRVLFRHLGLDPDVTRTPLEAIVLDRLLRGGLRSRGLLADALAIATLETGVGVWALDAERVAGTPELRQARQGEAAGEAPLDAGRLVVADDRAPLASLFADPPAPAAPTRATRRLLLYAVTTAGVPPIHAEEALWIAAETLAG